MDTATTDRSPPAEEPVADSKLPDSEDDPADAAGPIPSVYSATFSAAAWADVPPATRALLLSTVAETRRSFREEDASDLARQRALEVEESRAAMAAAISKEASDLKAAEDAVRARDDLRRRLGSAERAVIATEARAATSRAAVHAEQRRAYDLEVAHAPPPRNKPGSARSFLAATSLGRPARPSPSSVRPPPMIAVATAPPEITSPSHEAALAVKSRAADVVEQRRGSEVEAAHDTPRGQPGYSPRPSSTTTNLDRSARLSPPSARPAPSTVASATPEMTPPAYRYHELGVDRAFLEVPMRDFVRYRQLAFLEDNAVAVSAAAEALLAMMEDFPTATLSFVIRKSRPPLPSATVTAAAHELLLALRAAYKCSICTPKWARHQISPRAAAEDTSNHAMRSKNQRGKRGVELQGRRNGGRNPSSSSSSTQNARRDGNRRGRNNGGEPSSRSVSCSRPNKSRRQSGDGGGRSAPAGRATSGTRSQAQESSGTRQLKATSGQNESSSDVQAQKMPRQVVSSLEDASSTTAAAETSWGTDTWPPTASGATSWCANNTRSQSPASDA